MFLSLAQSFAQCPLPDENGVWFGFYVRESPQGSAAKVIVEGEEFRIGDEPLTGTQHEFGPTTFLPGNGPHPNGGCEWQVPEKLYWVKLNYDKSYTFTIRLGPENSWWVNQHWEDLNGNCVEDDGEIIVDEGVTARRGWGYAGVFFEGCYEPEILSAPDLGPNTNEWVQTQSDMLSYAGESEGFADGVAAQVWIDAGTTLPEEVSWTVTAKRGGENANKAGKKQQSGAGASSCDIAGAGTPQSAPVATEPSASSALKPVGAGISIGGGYALDGSSAGHFEHSTVVDSSDRAGRNNLKYLCLLDSGWEVVADSGGIRQVKTPLNLFDIVDITGGFEVRTYTADPNLAKGGDGLYPTTGTLLGTQQIVEASHNGSLGVSYVTLDGAGNETARESIFGDNNSIYTWSRHEIGDEITEVENWLLNVDDSNPSARSWNRTEITTRKFVDSLGAEVVAEVVENRFRKPGFLKIELLDESIEDPDGDALTTTYSYHEDLAQPKTAGKIDWVKYPDGSWERTLYTGDGRVEANLTPWLDAPSDPATATENNCRMVSNWAVELGGVAWYRVFSETILGTLVDYTDEKSIRINDPHDGQEGIFVLREEKSGKRSEAMYELGSGDGGRGALKWEVSDLGQITYGRSAEEVAGFSSSGAGSVTYGTAENPGGVAFRTTKVETLADGSRQTSVYLGNDAYEVISTTTYQKDSEDRVTAVIEDGVPVSETTYHANGDVTEKDREGIETRMENGGQKVVRVGVGAPDIVTETIREGLLTRVVTTGGSLSRETSSTPTSSTDETGAVHTTQQLNGGRTTVETLPGGQTITTEHFLDGKIKSVTGPSLVDEYHSYAIENEQIAHTVHFGTATSSRWQKTVGNTVTEPGPAGDIITARTGSGTTSKTERTGMAAQIFSYDPESTLSRSGWDLDGNGALTLASSDRVIESESFYEKVGQDWFQVHVQRGYLEEGSASPTELQRTSRKLGLGTDQEVTITRADGEILTITETVDRATKTRTRTTLSNRSSLAATEVYVNGLLQSRTTMSVAAQEQYTYDDLGRLESVVDARTGSATTQSYNASGQLVSVTTPAGTTSFGYYPNNHVNAGQLSWQEDGLGKRTYFAYDAAGRRTHQWGSASLPTRFEYDDYGQLTKLHTYSGSDPSLWSGATLPAAFASQTSSETTWIRDAGSGEVLQKLYDDGKGPTYTYYPSGLLQSRAWERGITTTYAYSGTGDLVSINYSDGTPAVSHTYRRDGRRATTSDAAGQRSYFYENPGGAPSAEAITGGVLDGLVLRYPNDPLGRRTSFSAFLDENQLMGVSYGFDAHSRLASVTSGSLSATYAYTGSSDLIASVTGARNGTTILTSMRTYDNVNRLDVISQVTGQGATVSSHDYTYDAAHRRQRADLADGSYWSYSYNDRDELTAGAKYAAAAEALVGLQFSYAYDDIGNRLSAQQDHPGGNLVTTSNPTALNTFGSLGIPGSVIVRGEADASSSVTVNGQTATQQGAYWHRRLDLANSSSGVFGSIDVDADLSGQLSAEDGDLWLGPASLAPAYDEDGNLTSDGRRDLTWNGENRLVEAETSAAAEAAGAPKVRVSYVYDGQGRRIERLEQDWDSQAGDWTAGSRTRFVFDGWNCVAVIDDAGSLVEGYVWGTDLGGGVNLRSNGPDQNAGGVGGLLAAWLPESGGNLTPVFYGYDGNGNVTGLVDAVSGEVVAEYGYTPFGEMAVKAGTVLASTNRYRFSTKPMDEVLGWYYYGYRYYRPDWGRWLNRDPIEEEGGFNLYAFVGNEPLYQTDISGMLARPGLRPSQLVQAPPGSTNTPPPELPGRPVGPAEHPSPDPTDNPFTEEVPGPSVRRPAIYYPRTKQEARRLCLCLPDGNGDINYHDLDSWDRATGVNGRITLGWTHGKGSRVPHRLRPAGFNELNELLRRYSRGTDFAARAHLWGALNGGEGTVRENVVAMVHNAVNNANMKSFEKDLYKRMQNGETLCFYSRPNYVWGILPPSSVTIFAWTSEGWFKQRTFQAMPTFVMMRAQRERFESNFLQ